MDSRAAGAVGSRAVAQRGCAMYGIVIEYLAGPAGSLPDPVERAACQALLVRQPGYRRRLALVADGWRRIVVFYLFASPDEARGALAGEAWRSFVSAHPACRDAAPALLVSESPWG